MTEKRRRGSYAKGIAKREEILSRALEVIAAEGYAGASVKAIADAVGLSQAGLLHYFDSKDELFTEILRKRDEVDAAHFGTVDVNDVQADALRNGYVAVVHHNAEVPGLVQLFSRLAVEATDPQHPAHEYFLSRRQGLRDLYVQALRRAQAEGSLTTAVDAELIARIMQAVADGMQLQWMVDPDVDMAAAVDALFSLVLAAPGDQPRSAATDA
ncbi:MULTISPECIES: TetR/AcrR family transcriptional regulator [Microbacterium]|jgi:AcrR family transcriptional regulator|uniref:TetR/AcrR family transcriptional regulator n=1 Tax=Microbacterium TaxID=33882 RepID=UPI00248D8A41|nr:TetR/AcrR family transcriptional regulator [Microbacterium aurum]MBZ6372423.1 TetR/AcrR family transcriptional regulator [Microbacterium hominis]